MQALKAEHFHGSPEGGTCSRKRGRFHDSAAGRHSYASPPGGHFAASPEVWDGAFSTRAAPRGDQRAHDMMRSNVAQNSK
eukprot:7159570-Pyramimonas_sp.AAC.1